MYSTESEHQTAAANPLRGRSLMMVQPSAIFQGCGENNHRALNTFPIRFAHTNPFSEHRYGKAASYRPFT
jgi:hypothetical protein